MAPIIPIARQRGCERDTSEFRTEVLRGLAANPKRLPCKYFYDRRGSQLFDQICELDEYYVTRTELAIMRRHADQMARQMGAGVMLIELGSGSSTKTRLLLDHVAAPAVYVPVDISHEHLQRSAGRIAAEYPELEVCPRSADFVQPIAPPECETAVNRRVVYFPGSTIGNFEPAEATQLLKRIARLVGVGGGLLLGIDMHKDRGILESAYDDPGGVTAAFNLNLLRRINRELDGDLVLERFQHRAFYNEPAGRVEMHLVSLVDQRASVASERFQFRRGESILTEYSHKYRLDAFGQMAKQSGWQLGQLWTDPQQWFSVVWMVRSEGEETGTLDS